MSKNHDHSPNEFNLDDKNNIYLDTQDMKTPSHQAILMPFIIFFQMHDSITEDISDVFTVGEKETSSLVYINTEEIDLSFGSKKTNGNLHTGNNGSEASTKSTSPISIPFFLSSNHDKTKSSSTLSKASSLSSLGNKIPSKSQSQTQTHPQKPHTSQYGSFSMNSTTTNNSGDYFTQPKIENLVNSKGLIGWKMSVMLNTNMLNFEYLIELVKLNATKLMYYDVYVKGDSCIEPVNGIFIDCYIWGPNDGTSHINSKIETKTTAATASTSTTTTQNTTSLSRLLDEHVSTKSEEKKDAKESLEDFDQARVNTFCTNMSIYQAAHRLPLRNKMYKTENPLFTGQTSFLNQYFVGMSPPPPPPAAAATSPNAFIDELKRDITRLIENHRLTPHEYIYDSESRIFSVQFDEKIFIKSTFIIALVRRLSYTKRYNAICSFRRHFYKNNARLILDIYCPDNEKDHFILATQKVNVEFVHSTFKINCVSISPSTYSSPSSLHSDQRTVSTIKTKEMEKNTSSELQQLSEIHTPTSVFSKFASFIGFNSNNTSKKRQRENDDSSNSTNLRDNRDTDEKTPSQKPEDTTPRPSKRFKRT